jgi:hypothetical protein
MNHRANGGWRGAWGDCRGSGGGRRQAHRDYTEAEVLERVLRHNAPGAVGSKTMQLSRLEIDVYSGGLY